VRGDPPARRAILLLARSCEHAGGSRGPQSRRPPAAEGKRCRDCLRRQRRGDNRGAATDPRDRDLRNPRPPQLDRPLADDSDATFADLIAAGDHDPAQETATSEFTALVAACMERLDRKHREILTMRNVLDLSYEEIARALGINIGTVKSRIARAREYLREKLAESCPEFGSAETGADFFLNPRATHGQPAVSYA